MLRFLLSVILSILSICIMAQTSTSTMYYKNEWLTKETEKEKALFSKTITTTADGIVTTEVKDIKKNEVLESKSYKGDEPVGIWTAGSGMDAYILDYSFTVIYSDYPCYPNEIGVDSMNYFNDLESIGYTAPKMSNGKTSVASFIASRVRYPEIAKSKRLEGVSTIFFTINTEGGIENITAAKGSNIMFDKETIRVIRLLTFSSPAIVNGKPKSICVKQRFKFSLS